MDGVSQRGAAAGVAPGAGPLARVSSNSPQSKLIGMLVCFDNNPNGEIVEIRTGRWLLTSRPTDLGDFIMIEDESISPLHGIIRATHDGKVQVLDQLSEYGTTVTKSDSGEEIDIAGKMVLVDHGDTIRFGERTFTVCLVPSLKVAD